MLQRHLRVLATSLDEREFRVTLRDNVDAAANLHFAEGPASSAAEDDAIRQALARRVVALGLTPSRGDQVLDVCAGRGHLGEALATTYGVRITFVDLSVAQLGELSRSGRDDHRNVCAGDVLRLPFRNGSFDIVVGHSFLHHVRDVPTALAELARVVRPGGTVALLHEPNVNANFWESFPLSLLKDTSPREGFTDLWMFTTRDLRRLFVSAGFLDVKVAGTGLLSGVLVNWYLLVLAKIGLGRTRAMTAGYRLRLRMNASELKAARGSWIERAPSLLVKAHRPLQRDELR